MVRLVTLTLLAIVLMGAFAVVMADIWPLGADYYYHFRPLADQWLDGYRHMYDGDSERLFYPPWSLFVIVPLGLFPLQLGQSVLFTLSLVGLVVSVRIYQTCVDTLPIFALMMATINLHMFDVLIRGQIDIVVLLGLVIGLRAIFKRQPWLLSLAFALMTVKPPLNLALPGLLYLFAILHWTRVEKLKVFLPLVGLLIVSSLMVGLDWPLNFIRNVETPVNYLSISMWRGAAEIGIPVWIVALVAIGVTVAFLRLAWREGLTPATLSIALATNFVITNYANGDHYILLFPALLYVARKDWRLALVAYATTWTPLLRLAYGPDAAPIDLGFPVVLLLSSWYLHNQDTHPTANMADDAKTNIRREIEVSQS